MLAYPITISPDGGLALSTDPIRDQILALLGTLFYERVMLTSYGSGLAVFDPLGSSDVGSLLLELELAIRYWINPGLTVTLDPTTDLERGAIYLIIHYGGREIPITIDINAPNRRINPSA